QVLVGQARGAAHARTVARERGGDVLVDGARGGALRVKLRIVLVGLDERLIHGAGSGARAHEMSVSIGPRFGRKRYGGRGGGRSHGTRCNLRCARNRPVPSSPRQHAQIPPPAPLWSRLSVR